ncbi:hypothetical protein ABZ753_21715 [Streptomyces griseoincarnatus]
MSAPLVVNTRDGVCWTRRTVTRGGIALYAPESVRTCREIVMATEAELAERGIVGSADVLPMPVREEPQALRKPVTDVAAAIGEGTVLLDSGATGFAPDLREALIGLLGTIAESGHRLLPASEDPPSDCRGCGGTGERYDGTGPDGHVWSGESCCCSHEHCSCGACGFPCELADYAVEVARGLVGHRAEAEALRARVAELEALKPAPIQTCRTCGAGYTYGQPCSNCQFNADMAAAKEQNGCPRNVIDGDVGGHFFKKGALSDSPVACVYCGAVKPEGGDAR